MIPDVGCPVLQSCSSLQQVADALRAGTAEAIAKFALSDWIFLAVSGEAIDVRISPTTGAVAVSHLGSYARNRDSRSNYQVLVDGRVERQDTRESPSTDTQADDLDLF
jgi:hypothetical protein